MSEHHKDIDQPTGVETTGHEWDGIKELNNPLPRWWLYIWYATIAFSVGYMVVMPALPALPGLGTNTRGLAGQSDRIAVAEQVESLRSQRSESGAALLTASLEEIETDRGLQQFAMASGESAFGDNCATCHGAGGRGAKGYPTLADDSWLWTGSLDGIQQTIQHGIRHEEDPETRFSMMPAFGRDGLLERQQIDDVVSHVLSLSGREVADEASRARGAEIFAAQCATCHGQDGKGDRTVGAPNLTDDIWVFGGEYDDVYNTVYNARNAHMPAWSERLDEQTIKALAVYVHSLGGGE
ncbi:MAG: cytochrome-c oxidase, cbb3-type subunit III [Henriciella sp.]|jgi:cytochrome c oxidase cbb3-type subunit 3|uniref:cytochrome-c oxidase, cbb3-type subunit III n=1 Tax=Henriciella sp. TaxID=1968823 RepID=UPI000C0D8AFD|nr:cytochrome-c oxidase, cbb3-type subunit III [Henriciella sp.]MAN74692.1 cytochrome-c oxidase, cbb3-type subunit III [Henriciella sp.]MBF32905.1 cytochrome-c oxidase, cbb3-type subunit III [Hyphomonadaceae bacterium]MBK76266.1 cytochrome-c oxidase, cbb3-type subunit III [Henriciella sp.]PHR78338.1 MAG: cytochrome-c oxidase, cbb3-type subunit III [Henriciella sp.]|tara:strand:+ start:1157 stop:2044 length:888 start_codon:yes stop_codon:yes gene_type:complete